MTGAGSITLPNLTKESPAFVPARRIGALISTCGSQYGREISQLALIELVPSCERNEIHRVAFRRMAILSREYSRRTQLRRPGLSRGEGGVRIDEHELVGAGCAGNRRNRIVRQEVCRDHAERVSSSEVDRL